ncbi:MAG: alpha/beta fold hydrolase [Bacteroidetes bacterium]|nr:alpha/beta fold hydrolase [Bacteroidota bacterium]
MKLFYRKSGQGQPLIIMHGLFGQSDNWGTLGRQFAEQGFEVYLVDLRNHGLSPHSDVWNYQVMSDDILELINDNNLKHVILMGHSMGGKVAMQFAIQHPALLDKLIVVDIAPKYYPPHNLDVLKALNAVDFSIVKNRKEVESILSETLTNFGTKQFLLKNIYWKGDTELDWRFNLKVITDQLENVGEATPNTLSCGVPTLFIRGGEKSKYILDEDLDLIQEIFPHSSLATIEGAGHWVHAEKPKDFFDCVIGFITPR